MTKIAIKSADGLIWLWSKLGKFRRFVGKILLGISKFTIFPILLVIYRVFLFIKIRVKNLRHKQINYIGFIKKYLPRLGIALILLSVATNNLLAHHYTTDEYVNRTLLPTVVNNDELTWNELVEDSEPAAPTAGQVSYFESEGTLQDLAVVSPGEDSEQFGSDFGLEGDSLAIVSPGEPQEGVDATGQRTENVNYTVLPGDVLGAIAEKFGITLNTLLWANDLTWNSTIRPGQTLVILPNSGLEYEVKSGDTVLTIARRYQADANNIVEANKLADSADIKIGDKLFIPDGIKPTQVVSSYQPRTVAPTPVAEPDVAIDPGTKLLWPVGSQKITQYYSWSHHAVDIGDKTGNPIYAAESGKVATAGWNNGGYGYYVIINHGNGIQSLYAHSSKLLVSAGDTVTRGDVIALVGSTGRSTGPHVHFEVIVNGSKLNPLNYIK